MEFPDFGSSEFDNISQLEYPTFCFLFPASNGRGVNYGAGDRRQLKWDWGVRLDRGGGLMG